MDEYISREAVLKKLQMQLLDLEADQDKGEYSELCENRGARDALDEAIYDIRTLKAADVQPVEHSRWISMDDGTYNAFCENCGMERGSKAWNRNDFKYCFCCGAKMDKEE